MVGYINELKNCDVGKIAKIATDGLHEEALKISLSSGLSLGSDSNTAVLWPQGHESGVIELLEING
jgi:hypothetical protein